MSRTSQSNLIRKISADGLCTYPGGPRQPVRESEVEIAMEYLQRFGEVKTLTRFAPHTGILKRKCEEWSGRYVSNGALLVAALRLGFRVKPFEGTPHAQIGVFRRDVGWLSKPRPQARVVPFCRAP